MGPDRRRLRFWKENSTSTETPEPRGGPPDDHDLIACESGMLNRRFAVGVLSLNPAKLRATMEQYQKRLEKQQSKQQAKRTTSAPTSDGTSHSVRYNRHSKNAVVGETSAKTPNVVVQGPTVLAPSPEDSSAGSESASEDIFQQDDTVPSVTATVLEIPKGDSESTLISSPESDPCNNDMTTSESQEPLVSSTAGDSIASKQSNGSALALARAHGIQPVNRQMSAGWL